MKNWLAQTWLGAYNGLGRCKGTIRISTDPELAVAEMERWASHPHFVQVMLNPFAGGLFGERRFWPVYEAASGITWPSACTYAAAAIAGLNCCRRLAKDRKGLDRRALAFLRLASIHLMLRKLCLVTA